MIRVQLILLTMLPLAGCNMGDFAAATSHATATLGIDEPAAFSLNENPVSSSIEPVASSNAEPVACNDYTWRGVVYDCNGNYLHDL